jgi:hypothetical protein
VAQWVDEWRMSRLALRDGHTPTRRRGEPHLEPTAHVATRRAAEILTQQHELLDRRECAATFAKVKRRRELQDKYNLSLRELYRSLELPGEHPLKAVHAALGNAVRVAYGMKASAEPLAHLLQLNAQLSAVEAKGSPVQAPGLPSFINDRSPFVTGDCLTED